MVTGSDNKYPPVGVYSLKTCRFTTLKCPRFLLPDRFSYLLTPLLYSFKMAVLFEPCCEKNASRWCRIYPPEKAYILTGIFACFLRFGNHCWPVRAHLMWQPLLWLQVKRHLYGSLFRQQAQEGPCRYLYYLHIETNRAAVCAV